MVKRIAWLLCSPLECCTEFFISRMQWNAGVWNNPLSCTSQHVATVEGSWQEIRTKTFQSTAESDHREGQDRATAGQADGPGREGLVEDLQSLFTT